MRHITKIIALVFALAGGFQTQAIEWNTAGNLLETLSEAYESIATLDFYTTQIQEEVVAESVVDSQVNTAESRIIYVPNYRKNFNLFLLLSGIGLFLVFAIFITLDSAKNITSSEYFKKRLIEKYKKIRESNALKSVLLLCMIGSSSSVFAAESDPWMKVSNSDLYWLMGLDVALFLTYLYVRSYVQNLINEIKTEEELLLAAKLSKKSSVGYILTKAVEIEEEHTILMDHEYDGIRELDNDLPPWWKWGFYLTIVWGVIYLFHFHVLKTGDLQAAEYENSMAKAEVEIAAYLEKSALNVDEKTATIMIESKDLAKGGALYKQYCTACHGQLGEGSIGPNLTDDYWIYGSDVKDLFYTIKYGAKNGMKSWKDELNPVEMQQVASYILHLDPVEGKEPQGDLLPKKPIE